MDKDLAIIIYEDYKDSIIRCNTLREELFIKVDKINALTRENNELIEQVDSLNMKIEELKDRFNIMCSNKGE